MATSIHIRRGRTDERNLVLQSFVREYSRSPFAKDVPRNVLAQLMSRFLDVWGFLVAVEPDSDEVLGFLVSRENAVAWIQVKRPYRRVGIARSLFQFAAITPGKLLVPFLPDRDLTDVASQLGYKLTFRPWLVFHA